MPRQPARTVKIPQAMTTMADHFATTMLQVRTADCTDDLLEHVRKHKVGNLGGQHFLALDASNRDDARAKMFSHVTERRRAAIAGRGGAVTRIVSVGRFCPDQGVATLTGLVCSLDELYGTPVIDATQLKAVGRRCTKNADTLFGAVDQGGMVSVGDALPVEPPRLTLDTVTPHHVEYFDGSKDFAQPWDSPIPVPFLSMSGEFEFGVWPRRYGRALSNEERDASDSAVKEAIAAILAGLDEYGIGARTSSGYGYFKKA